MTIKESLAAAVTGLLRQLNMDVPADTILADKVYTISTGQVDIELTATEDGRITLFFFPGKLAKLHLDSLSTLLLATSRPGRRF